jgi:phosphatidylserine decarboxylase
MPMKRFLRPELTRAICAGLRPIRETLTPIHSDGWKFVAAFAALTIILFFLWAPLGWIGVIATLWCGYFFRDPRRVVPIRPGLIVSPADGRIVSIVPAAPPAELGLGDTPLTRIAIFLNIFDVHVNRIPIGGRITGLHYRKGLFLNASLDKASEENERMAIRLTTPEGSDIAFVQVAGLIARRIKCFLREGEEVGIGHRFGLIRFGSRVDIYLPQGWTPLVVAGQRVIGGETVLADARAQEPPRMGVSL